MGSLKYQIRTVVQVLGLRPSIFGIFFSEIFEIWYLFSHTENLMWWDSLESPSNPPYLKRPATSPPMFRRYLILDEALLKLSLKRSSYSQAVLGGDKVLGFAQRVNGPKSQNSGISN